ncbi:MAG: MarR family transcriptional regulator [Candidatus Kapabacteria bacterium]|nr:MarR family transcriptional regulator [Candidatus Kapabacteria bacterium]
MGEQLKQRLKQDKFTSGYQEAILSVLVCADRLNRSMDATCEVHGITSAQYNVLRILRGVHPDGHPRCEIITRMIHAAPDVTRLIDRLEKLGLVERAKSVHDGRLSLTYITTKGLSLLETLRPEIDSIELRLSADLSAQDASTLTELCERVASSVE